MRQFFIYFLLSICICFHPLAQDSTKTEYFKAKIYSIETLDGTILIGTVVSENVKQLVISTKTFGLVTIETSKIKTKKEIFEESFKKGEYWFENPNATRYIIGPSAFTLKKGEGYYQNLYLFGQSVNVGITDHLTIGGGTEIASPIFAQQAPKVFFLTPKIGFNVTPKLKMGGGVLYVNVNGFDSGKEKLNMGILYGIATVGNTDNNATLGLGWGFHNSKTYNYLNQQPTIDKGFSAKPTFTISGMTRLSKRFGLVTENWISPFFVNNGSSFTPQKYQYKAFFSYGARFIGEKIAIDFGFFNFSKSEVALGIPYIDFVVKFGKK
jgi:hypothetical protein